MLRILHVEDDRIYLRAIAVTMSGYEGVELEQVETLAAAQERLSDPNGAIIDALLVDLHLPDAREMEAVAALRVYDIPLVVLSAYAFPEVLERAAQAGASDYIVKAKIDPYHIIRRVRFACQRHEKQNEMLASAVSMAASSRSPFKRPSLCPATFEALKPFITCRAFGG